MRTCVSAGVCVCVRGCVYGIRACVRVCACSYVGVCECERTCVCV